MTSQTNPTPASGPQSRRILVTLRDGRTLEASLNAGAGQSLALILASRRAFVNLTDVRGLGGPDEPAIAHIALRTSQILWAAALDRVPAASASARRRVLIHVEGGKVVEAEVALAERQRVSDYFNTSHEFVALSGARVVDATTRLGDIAIKQDAIVAVREADPAPAGGA